MVKQSLVAGLLALSVSVGSVSLARAAADKMPSGRSFVMSKINPSGHGGPLSWNDVAAAAKEKFADLDTDRDGQLDPNEATGVLTRKEFVAEDHDNDGVLDQTEFVIAVKTLFRSADIDRDGRLDKDLSTNQGVELVGLLAY